MKHCPGALRAPFAVQRGGGSCRHITSEVDSEPLFAPLRWLFRRCVVDRAVLYISCAPPRLLKEVWGWGGWGDEGDTGEEGK